jgi:hypothetical protein
MRRTTQNFHHNSKIKKIENSKKIKTIQESQTIKNYQNSYIYSKRTYCQNRINKKEEKKNLSIYNGEYNENVISKGSFTPYVIKNNENSISFYKARIIKNNKKINNIFLLEDKRDYQIYTYNPNQGFNYHQNYLKNKNEIHSDRNIYKRKYSLDTKKEMKSSSNKINNAKVEEIEINYNHKASFSSNRLRKNLKNEFNYFNAYNNKYNKIKKDYNNLFDDFSKNKLNNKYITYNNLININEPQLIHKDTNLIQNNENITPNIQTYLISFNSKKKLIRSDFKEEMIYHRPKSSSKFRNKKLLEF